MTVTRTLVFRAKLSRRTHVSLEAFLEEMRDLWNSAPALMRRISIYWPPAAPDRGTGVGPGIVGKCKQ